MKKNILGINIDDVTELTALKLVEEWLQVKKKYYVVTPNPEIIVAAQTDLDLQTALNNADLAIPDGVGLKFAGIKNRTPGIDLMEKIIAMAVQQRYTIALMGGRYGVTTRVVERLKLRYPTILITFAEDGGEVSSEGESLDSTNDHLTATDILFVAFGHGKQEKWIAKNLPNIPVRVAMAVGGAFDYLSGDVSRAPNWLRSLGLEWLFRLITQPWRVKRQLALLEFLWLSFSRGKTK